MNIFMLSTFGILFDFCCDAPFRVLFAYRQ